LVVVVATGILTSVMGPTILKVLKIEDPVAIGLDGDTLGTIAEAFGLDVNVLANINAIANIDLIYPNTVLNITTNDKNEITGVEITSTQASRVVTKP
ncbi:LysM peptidoglycan-binding domain-containing protein, partial [Streptococcus gordonii]|uniref:LysM peptidoglycan-binding domain-containing protein n=1 Tax=Streptococcus gordonii TaxID=1302 RepID=UPI0023B153A5